MWERQRVVSGGAWRYGFTNQIGQTSSRVEFPENLGLLEGDVGVWGDSVLGPDGLNNSTVTALLILYNIAVLDRGVIHLP